MDNKRLLLPQLRQFPELMTWRGGHDSRHKFFPKNKAPFFLKEYFIKNLIYTKEKCLGVGVILLHI